MKIHRITFVWNADFSVSGGLKALGELVQGEHSCTLCEIAYHRISQTKEWKSYRRELSGKYNIEVRQPCRNQLSEAEQNAAADSYPAVLARTSAGIARILDAKDIDSCGGDFNEFRKKLDKAFQAISEK